MTHPAIFRAAAVKFCAAATAIALQAALAVRADPVKIILDTDMRTDYDDAGALACLHALADAGECEILATVACTRDSLAVAACEIINAYYGRPEIPVGCVRDIGESAISNRAHYQMYFKMVKQYQHFVKHLRSNDAPDANEVYRRVLAAQPDGSVVICSIGFLTNLRKLVETDRDLVARKVKLWVAMACAYPMGEECNSKTDAESSRIAIESWPTPIVFSDFQYGMDCHAGATLAQSAVEGNPVADLYRNNLPPADKVQSDRAAYLRCGFGVNGRAAWDQTAVLAAVRGVDSYFNIHRGTYRMTGRGGENEWIPDEANGPHVRLTEKTNKAEVGRIIDELMSRPAARANK